MSLCLQQQLQQGHQRESKRDTKNRTEGSDCSYKLQSRIQIPSLTLSFLDAVSTSSFSQYSSFTGEKKKEIKRICWRRCSFHSATKGEKQRKKREDLHQLHDHQQHPHFVVVIIIIVRMRIIGDVGLTLENDKRYRKRYSILRKTHQASSYNQNKETEKKQTSHQHLQANVLLVSLLLLLWLFPFDWLTKLKIEKELLPRILFLSLLPLLFISFSSWSKGINIRDAFKWSEGTLGETKKQNNKKEDSLILETG